MIPLFFSEAACCPTEVAVKGVARNLISGAGWCLEQSSSAGSRRKAAWVTSDKQEIAVFGKTDASEIRTQWSVRVTLCNYTRKVQFTAYTATWKIHWRRVVCNALRMSDPSVWFGYTPGCGWFLTRVLCNKACWCIVHMPLSSFCIKQNF